MNYYEEIKNKLIDNEAYASVKDYTKERHRVITYFETGRLLAEVGKNYGENIINKYAEKLVLEVGKKYNKRTLFRMKQFYLVFSDEKVSPLATQLSWSHYVELLAIKDFNEIIYYIKIASSNNLTKRELREKIKSNEYNRITSYARNKILNNEKTEVSDLVPNPIVIKANKQIEKLTEYTLKELILNNLDEFLLQLGSGFSYIGNEYKIKIGDRYNYIDLLLYNYDYKCFAVVELKVTEFKAEYISQVKKYMNYVDKNIKKVEDGNTIGILICKKENKFVIEYCSDDRILIREYSIIK